MHDMKSPRKRAYDNSARAEGQARTRAAILDALGQALLDAGPGEVSLPDVASRAGVSTRTLYRHFGTRDRLLAALAAHVIARVSPPMPTTADELIALPPRLFELFDAHAASVEAMLRAGRGSAVRETGRAARVAHFLPLTAPLVAGMPPARARGVQALVKHLVSADTWLALRSDFGLKGREAGEAVSDVLALLAERAGARRARGEEAR